MMTDDNTTPAEEAKQTTPESVDEQASAQTAPEAPAAEATPAPEETATEAPAAAATEEPVVTEAAAPAEVASPETKPEPAPAPKPEPEPVLSREDDMALFEAAFQSLGEPEEGKTEGGYKKLTKGDRVEATVIQVDRDKVFVDIGAKSEGVVPLSELTDENIENAADAVKVGDKIQVVVIKPESSEGGALVSKKRADFEDLWDHIEDAFKAERTVNAQVVDRVKGGLVVDIGVRGFVPATHVGNGKLRNIEKYVGQAIPLKIIEIDRERKKVVLSNRQADEERRAAAKDELFGKVKPGDTLDGTVRRLTDYGAFIDLGGVDGLLHISEMSWMRIQHPKEMFKEGQKIQVMVLRLDPSIGKISLGHRQVLPDPWNLIKEKYTPNQKFMTTISRLVQSGAFVKLPEGAEAFIPVSEMSEKRIKTPNEAIEEGQEVEVQIIDLRPDERRMVLSIRAAQGYRVDYRPGPGSPLPSYDDGDRRGMGGKGGKKGGPRGKGRGRDDDFEDVAGRRGLMTGGATIGERLGALKGLLARTTDEDDEPEEKTTESTDEE